MVGTKVRRWGVVAISTLLLAACGGNSAPPQRAGQTPGRSAASASAPGSVVDRIDLPITRRANIESLVDVDGHDTYARCSGTGSPTVVYFTGWAPDLSRRGVSAIRAIEAVDHGRHLPPRSTIRMVASSGKVSANRSHRR